MHDIQQLKGGLIWGSQFKRVVHGREDMGAEVAEYVDESMD